MWTRTLKILVVASCALSPAAFAYSKVYKQGGAEADIYCDNKQLADIYYWNGTQWSNGVRWGTDIDALARQSVAAQGTACT